MTADEAKEHFNIKPCTNKLHVGNFGRLMIGLQLADDYWCDLTALENERKHYLSFTRYKSRGGTRFYAIIIWKLQILWAIT